MKAIYILTQKILKRFVSVVKLLIWKLGYGNSLKVGKRTFFYPGTRIIIDGIGVVKIGKNCFFNNRCSITSLGEIIIGDDCIIGENVLFYDHNHNYGFKLLYRESGYEIGKIMVGNNVWIGSGSIILPNTSIGDNVVIAAGSIVKGNIKANTLYYNKKSNVEKNID